VPSGQLHKAMRWISQVTRLLWSVCVPPPGTLYMELRGSHSPRGGIRRIFPFNHPTPAHRPPSVSSLYTINRQTLIKRYYH